MTVNQSALEVACFWLAAMGLWLLVAFFYRDYRIDRYRENLFTLRDRLFDMAADGRLDFNHAAYGLLRTIINSNIRFGHRIGFVWFFCLSFPMAAAEARGATMGEDFRRSWQRALGTVSEDVRRELIQLLDLTHRELMTQLLLTSPIFLVLVVIVTVLVAPVAGVRWLARMLQSRLLIKLAAKIRRARDELLNTADTTALRVGLAVEGAAA